MSDLRGLADALWPQARRIAERRCYDTLWRLRHGQGGFYDDQDFMQDLFLEFWRILPDHASDEDALWRAWNRALYRGGIVVLRRAPQRLWHRRPTAREADEPRDDSPSPETARRWNERIEALEDALWLLPPVERQILYMSAVEGQAAPQVARVLGLPSPNAARRRLSTARAHLRERYRAEVVHAPR